MSEKAPETTDRPPEPSLSEDLEACAQRFAKLQEEVDNAKKSGQKLEDFPEWWDAQMPKYWDLRKRVANEACKPAETKMFVDLFLLEADLHKEITGKDKYFESLPIHQAIYQIGAEKFAEALSFEDVEGSLHSEVLAYLEKSTHDKSIYPGDVLEVLKHLYGCERMSQLFGIKGNPYDEKIRSLLLSEKNIQWMRYSDYQAMPKNESEKWSDTQDKSRQWMSEALASSTGITQEEAMNYAFSASRKAEEIKILDLIAKFDTFGNEKIRKITEYTGIYSLEIYSNEQLQRMYDLVSNPDEFAASLKDRDVNLVMINKAGDYNGVMSKLPEDAEDSRTIFFEIARASDILKTLSKLKSKGIKPSTLVLAAHSSPGKFVISDERDNNLPRHDVVTIAARKAVALYNKPPTNSETLSDSRDYYSIDEMRGFARAIDEYMAPSRGIDDDEQSIGRKKIIFIACNAGTETAKKDLNEQGEEIDAGAESVVSQLAKDLISSGVKSAVDIYGAPDSLQVHKTPNGLRYSAMPTDSTLERQPLHAIRARVESGTYQQSFQDNIPLRK